MFTNSFRFLRIYGHRAKVMYKLSSTCVILACIFLHEEAFFSQEIAFCCHSMLILWNIKYVLHVSHESS